MNESRNSQASISGESKQVRTSLIRHFALAIICGLSLFIAACATPPGEIDSWPVTNAERSGFTGEVVDVLCELNGNCADNCGACLLYTSPSPRD